jgi:hypothetical protein
MHNMTLIFLAMMPLAALLLPVHEYFNWKRPRPKLLCDAILLSQILLLAVQAGAVITWGYFLLEA